MLNVLTHTSMNKHASLNNIQKTTPAAVYIKTSLMRVAFVYLPSLTYVMAVSTDSVIMLLMYYQGKSRDS
jgi:hypothetical protein